jgi:hypothetical protein
LPSSDLGFPEKRCGKTRNLQILGCLVRRPLYTANVTVASLTRAIDHYGPTLLIDEADTIFSNGSHAELRGILNAGLYRANAFVLRCIAERKQPKPCSVWCPKAIALIGRLPSTLEDRSIVVPMRRRLSGESVDALHYDALYQELETLRQKAAVMMANSQPKKPNSGLWALLDHPEWSRVPYEMLRFWTNVQLMQIEMLRLEREIKNEPLPEGAEKGEEQIGYSQ